MSNRKPLEFSEFKEALFKEHPEAKEDSRAELRRAYKRYLKERQKPIYKSARSKS
ncbi:hypothetical protein [Gracilimonas tropica]|uniref:hypothetical protein n=1 Tax=Gracilimonas tropica TaxID=454600 RepID=UPI0003773042|nr:hypothetical protein [Gracilimonas tropica]